jgi:hypothetical protein
MHRIDGNELEAPTLQQTHAATKQDLLGVWTTVRVAKGVAQ